MTKQKKIEAQESQSTEALKSLVNLSGTMAIVKKDDGLRIIDFVPNEDAPIHIVPIKGTFSGKVMRDGRGYFDEKKKRIRHKPLFREDHSSLSLGVNGMYYVSFMLPQEQAEQLPELLSHEILVLAQKFVALLKRGKEGQK